MTDQEKSSKFDQAVSAVRYLTGYGLKLAIVIVLAIVAWRLAWADINVDLSKFEFSDLLAMILAIFAIGMSVAFYFKTTDSSNQFYDNIYNFTQKTSEILGRIEERFGERLRHLDEGWGRMQTHLGLPEKSSDEIKKEVEEKKDKEQEEKQKLEQANEALQKMMNELFEKAQMQEQQRAEFSERLKELTAERDAAQERIQDMEEDRDRLRMQLDGMEHDMLRGVEGLSPGIVEHLLRHPEMRELIMEGAPPEILRRHSRRAVMRLPEEIRERLRDAGVLDSKSQITPAGAMVVRSMGRQFFGR